MNASRLSRYATIWRISDERELLLNSLSGAVDIVDRTTSRALFGGGIASLEPAILERLKSRGHLVPEELDESAIVEKLVAANCQRRRMLRFSISPTDACNLQCVYCFEKGRPTIPRKMSEPDVDLVFEAIDRITSEGPGLPRSISLFGGEPLLVGNRRVVKRIIANAVLRGLTVSIVTNGTTVEAYESELRDFAPHLKTQITLDGPHIVHDRRRMRADGGGTFDMITKGIDLLIKLGIPVNLRVNVDAENLSCLGDIAKIIKRSGWSYFESFVCNLAPVTDHTGKAALPNLMEEWQLVGPIFDLFEHDPVANLMKLGMFRSLDHLMRVVGGGKSACPQVYYCEANNFENFEFAPDGLIYACSECIGDSRHAIGRYRPEFNLFEDNAALWGNRNVWTVEKCRSCDIAFICGGGCAYSAISINGSLYEPHCGLIRKLIDAYVSRLSDHHPSFA